MDFEIVENEILKIENVDTKNKKFRLSSKKFILTYKTHLDKGKYFEWLLAKRPCKHLWVAHETGDKNHPYEHSHVLIEFETVINWVSPRCLDFDNIHPNIKKVTTKDHWENSLKYMCKEDKSNPDLLALVEKMTDGCANYIWKSEDLHDALKKCETVQEALGIKLLWDNRPKEDIKTDYVMEHTWQYALDAELDGTPSDRSIIWYYDYVGNTGKTMMSTYLEDNKDALVLHQMGGARDCATLMQNALDQGWKGNVIIVDLPRAAEDKAIYEPLEALKNGRMTAIKYNGGRVKWWKCHVVVMSNFRPDRSKLSEDRLDERNITPFKKSNSRSSSEDSEYETT